MKTLTYIRLSFMMFLEFFIWGGWFVTMGTFLANNLSATGAEGGMAYSTQSWGAIIAPFIIGLIINDGGLVIAASFLISGAGGDIYILRSIKDLPAANLLQDHDSNAGCLVLWPRTPSSI